MWGWGFKPPFSFSPGQWTPWLFAAFSNELFVHGGIASRKPAKHVIVVKYMTLLGEALSPGDKRVDVDVSEVSTLRFYWDFYVCNPKVYVCIYLSKAHSSHVSQSKNGLGFAELCNMDQSL